MINEDLNNRLWAFSKENICYATPGKLSNVPVINKFPLPLEIRKNIAGYENLLEINDEEYIIGTSNGYIIMNVNKFEQKIYDISINTIASNNRNATKQNLLDKDAPASLENKENEIGFTFSITEFDKHIKTKYQYQLIGVYDKWSKWTETSNVLFKNLAYGDYTFNVRGSTGESALTNTASYSFTIEKPWYLSSWMIAVYLLSIILVSFRIHTFYKRYYKRKEIALLSQTKKELDLAELENQKQLISLENQKLQQDIENKNRELAISTMSIIKKNEFLSTLKKELNNNSDNDLKRLVKIIDKNLNNTDDWKLFEEAFNNADKDFLKKMKAKHAVLTPNDLRLCAYLRLNLSSKEIAPLLNISPRSVEVKRYRLRKKMELPHESSLTNYILEI
jgi:AraC family chitin signaling transcriptional activator